MRYQLIYTKNFKKHFAKLNSIEKKQVKNKLEILIENPSHPSLRSKKIQGIEGVFESSVKLELTN